MLKTLYQFQTQCKGPFTHRTTSYVNLCATTDDVVRCRSVVVRCCPLSSVVARQITCIGMLMICKYSNGMAEYAVADVVIAAATFLAIFEDEEQEEQHRRSTRRHHQRRENT